MKSSHLALLAVLLAAIVAAVLVALGASVASPVLGADASAASVDGAGPLTDGAQLAIDAAARSEPTSARHAIATEDPAPAVATAPVKRSRARVCGRVVDRAGQPLTGARVWISTSSFWVEVPLDLEADALPKRWLRVEASTTDAEGRFAFEDLPPGSIHLVARHAGCAPSRRADVADLADADVDLADVVLTPGAIVRGTLLGPDGKPFPGAQVLCAADPRQGGGVAAPGRGVPVGTTDASGGFQVDELAPGPFRLLFLAEGHPIATLDGRTDRAGSVSDGHVVRLDPGVSIGGRIVAKLGVLPPDLRVGVRANLAEDEEDVEDETRPEAFDTAEARPRTADVGIDGTFRVDGLRAGDRYRITVAQRRGETHRAVPSSGTRDVRAPAGGVELVLEPEAAIVARVVDASTSLSIEDLVVWAGVGRFRVLLDPKKEVQRAFAGGAVRYGELRIQPGAKPTWFRISAHGYRDYERKDLVLAPGTDLDLGEVRLEPERRVVVTVLDPEGVPFEGARVVMTAEPATRLEGWSQYPAEMDLGGDLEARSGRTGADGTVKLTSRPGATVRAIATARGLAPSEVAEALLPKDADHALVLRLRRGARVVVRVTDPAGRALAGVPVGHRLPRRAQDHGDDRFGEDVRTDARGDARFPALDPGVHAFRVQREQDESSWWQDDSGAELREDPWQEIAVAADSEARVALVAPSRGTLTGVVRQSGRPLEGAVVKLVPWVEGRENGATWTSGGQDRFADTADHRGEYRIENRPAGAYVALVHHPDRRMPAEFRLELGAGEQVQDFTLETNEIHGRVTDPDVRPLVGVRITVARAEAGIDMDPPPVVVLAEDDRGTPNVQWRTPRGAREARTDAQGQYVLRGLVENTPIVVGSAGDEVEHAQKDPITLAPGEVRQGVDFVLRRAGRVRVELAGDLAEGTWYLVDFVRGTGTDAETARQVWLAQWNRDEVVGSLLPGAYVVRLSQMTMEGNATPVAESAVEVEVGKLARLVLRVP